MWKQKIGISMDNAYPIALDEMVRKLRQIGFEAISPVWESMDKLETIAAAAEECGLSIESLHAPFFKAAALWSPDKTVSALAEAEIFSALDGCIKFRIPILVVHTWIGFEYSFDASSLYFGNFEEIVAYARAHGVKIAFENTEGEEYLFALMEHFAQNDSVGFCWDSGHEMCFNRSRDLLEKYGDRLLLTHLNDNLGISRFDGTLHWTDDLHLLPYDGIADWDENIARLKKARKLEILNFELTRHSKPNRHDNDGYGQMSLEQYYTEVYKRACKIAYRYSK